MKTNSKNSKNLITIIAVLINIPIIIILWIGINMEIPQDHMKYEEEMGQFVSLVMVGGFAIIVNLILLFFYFFKRSR